MSFLASLTVVVALLPQAPQGGGQEAGGKAPILTPAERGNLRDKLAKFLLEEATYNTSTGKEREKASKLREKAKDSFEDDWKKAEKKGNLMGSMADLRAVFENCFLLKQPSISLGQLRAEKNKTTQIEYSFFLPKNYKSTTPSRAIWVLPGTASPTETSTWAKAPEYFGATWDKSASLADSLFLVGVPHPALELDPLPDFGRESGEAEEQRRIDWMWQTLAELMIPYNVDRNRVFLDCGRGACGFGLRFMTMYPDRFAGAVLRAPVEVGDLRLGSLLGIPILLMRTPATAAAVDALKKRLDEATPGTTTVMDATDEYPHHGCTQQIEAWLADKKRNAMPSKVVIEPNHDKYNRAYWADIDIADSLVTTKGDKRPRLECVADRAANRITVKTVGIERFTLFLNDDLVDLDKEFTVVVNDKAVTEKKTRSFRDLKDRVVVRLDWEFLFPVAFTTTVPK